MHSIIQQIEQNLVLVEKGSFMMGSENGHSDELPVHKVTLIRDFYLGKYPVTQAIWKTIMGRNPSYFKGENHPVERVSWNDIKIFIDNLNRLANGKYQYRLPNESEWEYAARGGKYGSNFQYSGSHRLSEVAWYGDNSYNETKTVGLKLPNALGIYDMTGNVWEWCEDKWHDNYENAPADGSARREADTKRQVFRGGSWFNDFNGDCRVAMRDSNNTNFRLDLIGFRLSRY